MVIIASKSTVIANQASSAQNNVYDATVHQSQEAMLIPGRQDWYFKYDDSISMTGYIENGALLHAWITIDGDHSAEITGNLLARVPFEVQYGASIGSVLFYFTEGSLWVQASLMRPSGRVTFTKPITVVEQSPKAIVIPARQDWYLKYDDSISLTGYIEDGSDLHAWITIDGECSKEITGDVYGGVHVNVSLGTRQETCFSTWEWVVCWFMLICCVPLGGLSSRGQSRL